MESRRIVSCILCLTLLLSFAAPINAQAEDNIISEGAFDFRITAAGAEVVRFYISGSSEIVVPSSVQGHPVVAIGPEVFRNLDGITRVVLQEGIQTIGDRAFYACAELESVVLPGSLKSIGEMAFCNCYALGALQIPANVREIGSSAFLNCSAMHTLQVDGGNSWYKAVDNVLFSADMTVLIAYLNTKTNATYTVPEQVRRIGEKAFLECIYLQEVKFPGGLVEIEKYAFSGCGALTAVSVPDSVGKIGAFAFGNCGSLSSVTLGNGITTIPAYAFNGCGGLKTVNLPDSLRTIESKAFADCTIEYICVPNGVTQIAEDAFAGATIGQVRFYTRAKKNELANRFPQSQCITLCKGAHTYQAGDPTHCTVCDYVLDLNAPPELAKVTHDTVQLVAQSGFEYSYDKQNWKKDGLFTGLQPNHEYGFYARLSGLSQISQPLKVTTDRAPQGKAPAPVAQGQDSTSVTLKEVGGCEYSMDGQNWQSSPRFEGLQPNTEYTFYQRYAQSQTHYAGAVSDGAVLKTGGVAALTSDKYTVQEDTIRTIPVGTTAETLLQGLRGGEYCTVLRDGTPQDGKTVLGTGMTVQLVMGGAAAKTYTLIVTGDTNGDGEISITDMIAVKAHILEKKLLTGVYAQAADTSGDGGITITDFIQIKAKILGKGNITAR